MYQMSTYWRISPSIPMRKWAETWFWLFINVLWGDLIPAVEVLCNTHISGTHPYLPGKWLFVSYLLIFISMTAPSFFQFQGNALWAGIFYRKPHPKATPFILLSLAVAVCDEIFSFCRMWNNFPQARNCKRLRLCRNVKWNKFPALEIQLTEGEFQGKESIVM